MIGIEVKGLDSIRKKFEKLGKGDLFKDTIKESSNVAFDKCHDYYVPVDSGKLRDSIYLTVNDDSFELGATAKHAVFNEYGCYNLGMGPAKYKGYRPFLRPSILFAQQQFPKILHKNFERVMHG